ncbi:MAG: hypothetical protein JNJ61_21620 [Anaerolineae bacterium]|nr:hypothetical protein [Anaerolineae bacterium]
MTDSLHPHEEHDSQRSLPLIERLQTDTVVINPPIVAPFGASQYVILDGANRYHAFSHLHLPHILVQVTSYDSGYVELKTWQHVISKWTADDFLTHLNTLSEVHCVERQDTNAIAHILFRDGRVLAVVPAVENTHERNAALRKVVSIYQRNAVLQRTALTEPMDIWPLYPDAIAIVTFPAYTPADIIAAARHHAFLPPGISRHIIHGRALRLNYPLDALRDKDTRLIEKNLRLATWIQTKLENRSVRYYAEATYQFDE